MSSCMRYQQQISQMLDGELPAEQVQTVLRAKSLCSGGARRCQ